MRPRGSEPNDPSSLCLAKEWEALMRLLARGATTAIVMLVSLTANAADLNFPSPLVAQPQYGMASPPPAVAPPQVIIVPGPTASPQYNSAAAPPPPVGAAPYCLLEWMSRHA